MVLLPHSLTSLNKLKPQNRALPSEQDSCGLRQPRARPVPTPTHPLPHPIILHRDTTPKRATSQSVRLSMSLRSSPLQSQLSHGGVR